MPQRPGGDKRERRLTRGAGGPHLEREMGGDRTSDKSASKAGHGKGGPKLSEDGKARAADRQARLAEALRANLKKRKAQTRGRGDGGAE